jgi:LDH2 family malate/lactate/ureidoglycolate dehydrogenase
MVTQTTCIVPVDILQQFMKDVFIRLGVPEDEAKISAEILITSDLRGIESHGIGRLKMYYDRIRQGTQFATTQMEIIRESPTTAVIDGHHGRGQVIGYRSMTLAIEKARAYGMGAVAVRNSSHFGIAGYYPLMAIKAGMIGMAFTNARPSIAPTFSVKPMLGTNPIAFGCPTDEDFPFLYDAATSITNAENWKCLTESRRMHLKAGSSTRQENSWLTPENAWTVWQRDCGASSPGRRRRDPGRA